MQQLPENGLEGHSHDPQQPQPPQHDGLVVDNRTNRFPERNSDNNTSNSFVVSSHFPPPFVVRVAAVAGLGGILFGYDLGVVSTALPHLADDFQLSKTQEEWVVSILYVGGFLGALLGGSLCDTLGRKVAILVTDVVFILGALLLFVAPSYAIVLLGRIVVGFAVAVSGIADVAYLHEISPLQWRGSLVSVNEACISLGFLLAFATGSILSELWGPDAWRTMFGLSGIVALVQLVGMLDMPESPKWLRECGRHEESAAALQRIHSIPHGMDQATEATPMEHHTTTTQAVTYDSLAGNGTTTQTPEEEDEGQNGTSPNYNPHPTTPIHGGALGHLMHYVRETLFLMQQVGTFVKTTLTYYPRQGWITVFLAVTQQLCGQTNVLSYAPQIFASVSASGNASTYVKGWTTVSIGIVKFLVTVLVIWKIDSVGRRPLLLSGMGAIAAGLLLLILASAIPGSSVRGSRLDQNDDDTIADASGNGFGMAISGVMLVVCGYSLSFGPLTWLLTSEIFPTDIRGRALGASTLLNFGSAILVTSTFLSFQAALGNTAVFGFYLLVTVVGLCFALIAIPETKGKSVAQIDVSLDRMLWWRGHTRARALHELAQQDDEQDPRRRHSKPNGHAPHELS